MTFANAIEGERGTLPRTAVPRLRSGLRRFEIAFQFPSFARVRGLHTRIAAASADVAAGGTAPVSAVAAPPAAGTTLPIPPPSRRVESVGTPEAAPIAPQPYRSGPEQDAVVRRFNAGLRARFDIDVSDVVAPAPTVSANMRVAFDVAIPASNRRDRHVGAHRAGERPSADSTAAPAQPWRAWVDERKPGSICVIGSCRLPAGSSGCRVTLQEAISSMNQEQSWGEGSGGSAVLVLERVLLPAPFGSTPASPAAEQTVNLSYRKPLRSGGTQATRYTHVSIMPDGLLLPIEQEALI